MYLVKRKDGAYVPHDDADYEASKKIKAGGVVKATQPRNYKHHKKAFALLTTGYENQEKYKSFEIYRKVMTILAGFYDEVRNTKGEINYMPHSISFQNMTKEKFEYWYKEMVKCVAQDMGITVEELENEI